MSKTGFWKGGKFFFVKPKSDPFLQHISRMILWPMRIGLIFPTNRYFMHFPHSPRSVKSTLESNGIYKGFSKSWLICRNLRILDVNHPWFEAVEAEAAEGFDDVIEQSLTRAPTTLARRTNGCCCSGKSSRSSFPRYFLHSIKSFTSPQLLARFFF